MRKSIISADEFAERVNKASNRRINIVKETYTGTHNKVTAYCTIHKIYFEVSEAKLLTSKESNCPECIKDKRWFKVYDSFINTYGNKFSYDKSSYCGYKNLMKVHCNDCGTDFEITLEHHLKYNNGGCPNCHKYKTTKCQKCGKEIKVDSHCSNDYRLICDDCKKQIIKEIEKNKFTKEKNKQIKCSFCGSYHSVNEKCQNELCNTFHSINDLKKLIPFGFDYSTIGTINYIEEFYKATKLLLSEYFDNKLSTQQIYKKYNCQEYFRCEGTLRYFLKQKLKQNTRNLSEAQYNSIENGTHTFDSYSFQFKTEYHISWNNQVYLLRSSYESEYANLLDNQKIQYEVEKLKIKYFDTQMNKQRVAIPDFYLPETNTIVEVKSKWTFDKQNMIDRRNAYLKLGYDFKLLYEHKFVDLDAIDENKHNLEYFKHTK